MKKNPFLLFSIICLTLTSNSLFATALSVSLTPSSHHGFAVSCFGGRDGAINITVTGGTSPYTYHWSTGATTQNINGLASGFYEVTVTDAGTPASTVSGNVTLTEPTQLHLNLTPSIYYPQTTNSSCYNCCNSYINTGITGGVTAYSYSWSSGQTTANLANLCIGTYGITVTDANGCTVTDNLTMTQPDKDTWAQTGNSGSNPSTQFIGNIDSVDLSFRTNNIERARVKANGDISINSLSGNKSGMLYSDDNGYLWSTSSTVNPIYCPTNPLPVWYSQSSPTKIIYSCNPVKVGIGVNTFPSNIDVHINGNTLFDNKVIIGTGLSTPTGYKLYVADGILTEKVKVAIKTSGDWSDKVFDTEYPLGTLSELKSFIQKHHHLPGIPSADEVVKNGIDLGEMDSKLLQKIEELTLHVIRLEEELNTLKAKYHEK